MLNLKHNDFEHESHRQGLIHGAVYFMASPRHETPLRSTFVDMPSIKGNLDHQGYATIKVQLMSAANIPITCNALLDTGATVMVINPRIFPTLKTVATARTIKLHLLSDGTTSDVLVHRVQMSIPALGLPMQTCECVSHGVNDTSIDLILGTHFFFKSFNFSYDGKGSTFELSI